MRKTFRDKAGAIAWQKQLRDEYVYEGVPPVPHLDVGRAIVKPISRRQAEQIILKYEWLGTMATTGHHYGLFFGLYCAGVCCYAAGSTTGGVNSHMEWDLCRNEFAVLARGANTHWSPTGANSRLVSLSCKMLAKDTQAKIVIAYSDTDAGEIGTIYQACNWVCVGRGSSTNQWIAPNGRIYDQKLPYDLRRRDGFKYHRQWYVKELKRKGWREQQSNPKYRYVYVLDKKDKRLVELVESKRVPYPKRDMPPVNGDNVTTSHAGRFDPDPEALEETAVSD